MITKQNIIKKAKTVHLMPANLQKKDYLKVLSIAKKAHKALNCKGVTRADFKFFKKVLFIRAQYQPGMTNFIVSS